MNKTIKTILSIAVVGVLLYFLVWPWINSAISSAFHIKAATEGCPSQSYTDEKTPESTKDYSVNLDEELYNKLAAVAHSFLGAHLFARNHNGYAFFYESTDMFFSNDEKEELLSYAKILANISRGDEKYEGKRRETYKDHGLKQLDEYIKEHGIEVPETK